VDAGHDAAVVKFNSNIVIEDDEDEEEMQVAITL
jgi:hypothetical protein